MPQTAPYSAVPVRVRKQIMTLHEAGERSDDTYDVLRADLDSVPKRQRGVRWRRVDVLLDVHFRRYGRRVIRRLARLRDTYNRRGQPERFERLWASVQRLLGDLTVTTHGYSQRLDLRATEQLWSQVRGVLDQLDAAGHQAFVNSGTLLGLVRGDGVIANDDDVDLAVLLRSDSSESAAYEWIELRKAMRDAELLDVDFDDRARTHTKAASPDGLMIDMFPAWISDRRLYLFPYSFGDVDADDVIPLKSLVAGDSTHVPGPAHPEALLTANYGDAWRIPDPLFAFDWASAKQRFSRFSEIVTGEYVRHE